MTCSFQQQNMFVIPAPFAKEHKHMLAHCKELIEYQMGISLYILNTIN